MRAQEVLTDNPGFYQVAELRQMLCIQKIR